MEDSHRTEIRGYEDWKNWKPDHEKDSQILAVYFEAKPDGAEILYPYEIKALINLHLHFTNLVSISIRRIYNAPFKLLDNLSAFKNLMYLDLYDTNITQNLTEEKAIKILTDCPNLMQADLTDLFGLNFRLMKDNKISEYCERSIYVRNGGTDCSCECCCFDCECECECDDTTLGCNCRHDRRSGENNDGQLCVIAENYPKIISWSHCRYPSKNSDW